MYATASQALFPQLVDLAALRPRRDSAERSSATTAVSSVSRANCCVGSGTQPHHDSLFWSGARYYWAGDA